MKPRTLTLTGAVRDRTPRPGEVGRSTLVPFLRVQGRRLEVAGFNVGGRVRVEVQPGRLIVTREEEY